MSHPFQEFITQLQGLEELIHYALHLDLKKPVLVHTIIKVLCRAVAITDWSPFLLDTHEEAQ